jgi:peroxiredoxin
MSRFALALALALLAVPAFAQTDPRSNTGGVPPEPRPPRLTGLSESPRVASHVSLGDHAPDFQLTAAGGAPFRLKQSRGGWVALFFAGDRTDLDRVAGLSRTLDSLRFRTVVVCPEHEHALSAWLAAAPGPLTPLADEQGAIAALYGLYDATAGRTRPGVFLLDPQGVVRVALLGQSVEPPSLAGLVQTAVETP